MEGHGRGPRKRPSGNELAFGSDEPAAKRRNIALDGPASAQEQLELAIKQWALALQDCVAHREAGDEQKAKKAKAEAEKAKQKVEKAKAKVEEAKAEGEKAKAEVEKAKAEAKKTKQKVEKAKAEVEKAKAEGKKAKAEGKKAKAEGKKAKAEVSPHDRPDPTESLAGALRLIDINNMHCVALTATKLNYHDTGTLARVSSLVDELHDPEQLAAKSNDKGQPIIGVGGTSGVGKSRLCHELRKKYQAAGDVVIVVTYNTMQNQTPTAAEQDASNPDKVQRCFRSRLLSAMLPDPLPSEKMASRFNVSKGDVVEVLAQKCRSKDIKVFLDEAANLSTKLTGGESDDRAMQLVVEELGSIAHGVSQRLREARAAGEPAPIRLCLAIFTALSKKMIHDAKSVSLRNILTAPLALLSKEQVDAMCDQVRPELGATTKRLIYSITAGHARSVDTVLNCQWDEDTLDTADAVQGIVLDICKMIPCPPLSEAQVRHILLEEEGLGTDFQELSRKSIVHVGAHGHVLLVPAFLFGWATQHQATSGLAKLVRLCLLAAWRGIFISQDKQGTSGKPLQEFLWHFEAVRRELIAGMAEGQQEMTIDEFYRQPPTRRGGKFKFPKIRGELLVSLPGSHKWADVDTSVINNPVVRYIGETDIFPKYEWFSVMVAATDSTQVRQGVQAKHGAGIVQKACKHLGISVKMTTKDGSRDAWERAGWIWLGPEQLRQYVGTTVASAAACLFNLP